MIGENIKKKLPNKDLIVEELMKFCGERVYHLPFDDKKIEIFDKQDTIEISQHSAQHLINFIDDYSNNPNNNKKGLQAEAFNPNASLSFDNSKNVNRNLLLKNIQNNSKIKIKFDTDKEKTKWLNKEIQKNRGQKNISLAVQNILQNYPEAFLRSWSLTQFQSH